MLNPGVLDAQGNCLPPQFDHYVDDDTYADIAKKMILTVSASVLSLWILLGFPDNRYPNPLSMDKLVTRYSHQRVTLGYKLDSRKMEVEVLPSRCEAMIVELAAWIDTAKTSFPLRELASLHGILVSMTHYMAWSRPLFHLLQNVIRIELHWQYLNLQGYYHRTGQIQAIRETLLPMAMNRLSVLVTRDKASILWSSWAQMTITASLRSCLTTIHGMLDNPSQWWAQPIGYIVPRDRDVVSFSDASG